MKTVLVTGGTGFVGTRLVKSLRDRGWSVRVMSRQGGDVAYPADGVFDKSHIGDAGAICHLAAYIPPRMDDPQYAEECFRVNGLHTLSLLRAAADRVQTFVHVSSGNVYAPASEPRREGDLLYPDSRGTHYLLSKIAGEVYASAFGKSGAFRAVVLRPSSVYGPRMAARSMLSTFLERARSGTEIQLNDGGAFGADLVYVDDVVNAIEASLERDVTGAFNVGSGRRTTALEAARIVCAVTGFSEENIRVTGEPPAGMAGFAALDVTRAREDLAYDPVDLEDGLRRWIAEEQTA